MTRVAPVNAPKREVHSADMATRALPPIVEGEERPDDSIETLDELPAQQYLDELSFMQEKVKIIINPSSEKNAPKFYQVGVNGVQKWVMVGVPTILERSYVEVLARSQPIKIETRSGESDGDQMTYNIIDRQQYAGVSFSVIEDRNPKGAAWLAKVIREG